MENLKGIVHVTGRVELDSDGLPHRIVDVTDIRALDLSPLVLKPLRRPRRRLFLGNVIIEPSFEDDHVVFKLPDLNIVATGNSDDAIEKLCSDFACYGRSVLAPPEGLSQDAKDLAEHLRAMVRARRFR